MKGLSFDEAMVKAWMEGRKTVTRRLMNPQPNMTWEDGRPWWPVGGVYGGKPPCLRNETVYIKETWAFATDFGNDTDVVFYKASYTNGGPYDDVTTWKSPVFMPETASRSHALIVSVSPEMVQEITREDALKEGAELHYWGGYNFTYREMTPPVANFRRILESIYPGSWERNVWVWRIELEKLA